MKKIITKDQQREIVELAKDHSDAIIAAMADMYRQGCIKGAIYGAIGVFSGYLIFKVSNYIKDNIHQKKSES